MLNREGFSVEFPAGAGIDIQEVRFMAEGGNRHPASDNIADNSGPCGAPDTQLREEPDPVDQKVIENDVEDVGDNIGFHGYFRIARSPLGGVDGQRNSHKNNADHQDLEIADSVVDRVGLRT